MNNLYDNGTCLLGTKKNIVDYIINTDTIEQEDKDNILQEIEDFDDTDILCINYDWGMGLSIDGWSQEDKILEVL